MSIEIKKEDPLEAAEYSEYFQSNEYEDDEENSMDFEPYSSPQTSSKATKSRERLSNPTTIEMPTKDEIMMIRDLNWRIALQRHKTTQELTNDSRTKVAKLLIKHIYERKFQNDGNYDLKMTTQNFQFLADTLVSIFPTEVAETYFCRSVKGKNATGKLYNAFVNTRSEIVDAGLLQVNRRNMNKSDSTKNTKADLTHYVPPPTVSKFPDAMNVCCSKNFDDVQNLTAMWESCYDHRQSILREKQTLEYFNMFPFLKESDGHKLVS
jgi:hypothetical protein